MKTRIESAVRIMVRSFGEAVCAAAVTLVASSAPGQNMFEVDYGSGNIYEFTPGEARSTFASGLYEPTGLAIDSAGDLFVGDGGTLIYKFTPGGGRSPFASGLSQPTGLAFNRNFTDPKRFSSFFASQVA